MTYILPVASGKGGVGKTLLSSNLGVALAQAGKTVVLIDLDLGGSNLHTLLGIRNRHPGIGNLILKQEPNLSALLVTTEVKRLHFIPGDVLLPGTANLSYAAKRRVIRGIQSLPADFVILDLGSGSAYNTVDFFLCSSAGIIVTTPETTAVLNAYTFLKTSLFRALQRSFAPKSAERGVIADFMAGRIEGSDASFANLISRLSEIDHASGSHARSQMAKLATKVVINMGRGQNDLTVGTRLREIVRRNLDFDMEYIGFVPFDAVVPRSVIDRKPVLLTQPESSYARAIRQVVAKLLARSPEIPPALGDEDEDLVELSQDFTGI